MKKSRIFMTGGGLVLAIAAIFATKANKKFATSIATVKANGHTNIFVKASTDIFTAAKLTSLAPLSVEIVTRGSNHVVMAVTTLLTTNGAAAYASTTNGDF